MSATVFALSTCNVRRPIPQWMVDRWSDLSPHGGSQKIGQAEILAAIAVYFSLPADQIRGRRVLHFIDNTSALYAIFNGYSRAPDSSWLVNIFHCMNATPKADVWWAYVATKANVADLPSRGMFDFLRDVLDASPFEFNLDENMWATPPHIFLPTIPS